MKRVACSNTFLAVLLLASAGGCAGRATGRSPAVPELERTYGELLRDVKAYNEPPGEVSGWLMNSEHLFHGVDDPLDADSLRNRAIRFTRLPGGLDLLLGRLADRRVGADEVLAVAEVLVYYGQHHLPGDEAIGSRRTEEVREAIRQGRLEEAERRYPRPPIRRQIGYALDKAERNAPAKVPTTGGGRW